MARDAVTAKGRFVSNGRMTIPRRVPVALLCVAAAALLSACASPSEGDAVRASWVGATEAQLVDGWGPPSRVDASPEGRAIRYERSRMVHVAGTPAQNHPMAGGGLMMTPEVPAMDIALSCTTAFVLKGGIVTSVSVEGNDCRDAPVARRLPR